MTPNLSPETLQDTLLEVDPAPMAMTLPAGSVIFAYAGTIWITQEGLRDDVILRPGERFAVRNRALIVISAVRDDNAKVWVAGPEGAAMSEDDLFALLRKSALRQRAAAIEHAIHSVRDRLSHALTSAAAAARRALEPSYRVHGH
ncbi:MAG TPA: DUF2917 domain-containing protein [Burkholderiaceae bacterium]|nr:DUF2917 domain-containing protein [Burkholderiaceae bacterium]